MLEQATITAVMRKRRSPISKYDAERDVAVQRNLAQGYDPTIGEDTPVHALDMMTMQFVSATVLHTVIGRGPKHDVWYVVRVAVAQNVRITERASKACCTANLVAFPSWAVRRASANGQGN